MTEDSGARLRNFQTHRAELVLLAYRMLGDVGRAEDVVQEAWLRWSNAPEVESPRAYLVTIVTRLCLQELRSARARKEESRSDRLPEPVDLREAGLMSVERLEQVSMAFGVVLQRLTPAERAVLLLHDVFEFDHGEVARLLGRSQPASRKLLERARVAVRESRRMLETPAEEHRQLLRAFVAAAVAGDVTELAALLAEGAVIVSDGGAEGRAIAGFRNLRKPLRGGLRVAAFVVAATQRAASLFEWRERELNGQPAVVFYEGGRPAAALLLGVIEGKIHHVFFHADASRLQRV